MIDTAADKRRREFTTARWCARRALGAGPYGGNRTGPSGTLAPSPTVAVSVVWKGRREPVEAGGACSGRRKAGRPCGDACRWCPRCHRRCPACAERIIVKCRAECGERSDGASG
ncbi:hypothetical protein [Actinomadura alba]|uniref:4'-phosphopantetheinyl transferase N-terminal domain-containing protein n=1 Tax=Actinomadura alba TaxID=406431 RepID=A0ABR7LP54_9ACTN|nr:hypothetical protein [Actinomadura alba]MBC6466541.1 hypothetical protein [Actinomadura alba]